MNPLATEIPDTLEARVRKIAEEAITDPALFLVDVNIRGNKGSRVVEIFVDSDRNIDINTLALLNREIGFMLDTEDIIDGRYHLQVSSPGVDRPLNGLRQYRKNLGRPLRVKCGRPEETLVYEGALTGVDESGISLQQKNGGELHLPFETILEARVLLPW